MPIKSNNLKFDEELPRGPIPSANLIEEITATKKIPTAQSPVKKKRVAIPKFKTLLRMLKTSESQIISKESNKSIAKQNTSLFSSSRDSFDYTASLETLNTQRQKLSRQDIPAPDTAKTQRILSYRNLLKTTRENFKRNLIDYMNKRRDDKKVKNTGYRFPVLSSRSTFITNETAEDEEKLHISNYQDSLQNKLNSSSLPNLNTHYTFNKQKEKENHDFKLPSMPPANRGELFTTEQSLKEDSIFWSKYKRTIRRQMKYAQDPLPNGVSTRMQSNYTNRIPSISEEDQVVDFSNKNRKSVGEVFYSEPQERFKSSSIALSEKNLNKLKHNKTSLSADIQLSSIYDRRHEVAVKY